MATMKRYLLIPVLAVASFFAGCTTVPETGRRQLVAIPAAQEAQMGLSAFAEIKQNERVSQDPQANARVQRVGERIAAAVGREIPNAEWEFVVFESDSINAFALPGGKVGVYTGLLNLVGSDDELAAVIGHEVAHVTSRHGAERVTQNLGVAGIGVLAAIGMEMGDVAPGTRNVIMGAYGLGTTIGVMLPYSRLHEMEADEVGLRFAAAAGYDPRAAATFWRRMQAASAGRQKPPEFLSTHPADERRIATLEALAPQFMELYETARQRYR
jgi:metalloendopeptidase OMA1, mitochondrial